MSYDTTPAKPDAWEQGLADLATRMAEWIAVTAATEAPVREWSFDLASDLRLLLRADVATFNATPGVTLDAVERAVDGQIRLYLDRIGLMLWWKALARPERRGPQKWKS